MKKNPSDTYHLLFTGTDPSSHSGGIATVVTGYISAATLVGISNQFISTFRPTWYGKTILWIVALPRLLAEIRSHLRRGVTPVIYSHTGGGFSFLREALLISCCRLFGAKTIMHIHAPQVEGYLKRPIRKEMFRMAVRSAHMIVVLTAWWKRLLEEADIGVPVGVISNPLPDYLYQTACSPLKRKNTKDDITVLVICRLVAGKGVDIAIQAMKYLPKNLKMVIAGDGAERLQLEAMVKAYSLESRVSFAGWVSGADKAALFENSDLFCLPSTNDAFPMTFVEAMAYGLPVVGVQYAGIPDMVAHGQTGYLVSDSDPKLVAKALSRITQSTDLSLMGDAGKRWILSLSSPEIVGESIRKAIQCLT